MPKYIAQIYASGSRKGESQKKKKIKSVRVILLCSHPQFTVGMPRLACLPTIHDHWELKTTVGNGFRLRENLLEILRLDWTRIQVI